MIPRPTGKLKDTVTCAQNPKAHLRAFLEHGEIEISSNQVENAIRPFVVGRKRWLFADTPRDAEASAIIYPLLETAKANNEVLIPGRVSAGNHDVSIPRDD